jgi:hypothetical protein
MTEISSQYMKEAGAFLITTAWSCGPSQLFGCIKLLIDICLLQLNNKRKNKINSNIQEIQKNWNDFKTSSTICLVAKKLGIESRNFTQESAKNYFNAKNRKIEEKINRLSRSIRADAYALIPLIGAHISWRVATDYKGKSFTPIFSHTIEQLLENSKAIASRPLFWGRKSRAILDSTRDHIEVPTSTKNRKIQIYYQLARKLNERGEIISSQTNTPDERKKPTVVLFHPNMGTAEGMAQSAEFYREKGYNTLAVTFGGYQGSPGVTTSEKSMYQDIEAVKSFLSTELKVTQVGYHGFSLGSGAAFQAATGESFVKNLQTLFVVVDQPYTSVADIGDNIAGFLGRGILSAGCPIGLDVELPGGLWTKTDGLNNLRKVTALKEKDIPLFCFETKEDFLMGRKKKNGTYTENFAQDLLAARYGDAQDRTQNLVTLSGGHGSNSLRFKKQWQNEKLYSSL